MPIEPAEGLHPAVIEAQLTPAALDAVRAAPEFRATVERYAADAIAADTGWTR